MATYIVFTYRCPRCRADIGRRFGLYTKRKIPCPRCGTGVRIDAAVFAQNWGYNFGWVGGVLACLVLGFGVLISPDFAATVGGNTLPSATEHDRLVLAGMSLIPGLLAGLVFGGVGMVLGAIVAAGAAAEADDATEVPPPGPGPGGGFRFLPPGADPQPSSAAATGFSSPPARPASPPRRGLFVRAFFALLWPIVFFFAAGFGLTIVAMSRVKSVDPPPPAAAAGTVGLLAAPQGQGPLLAAFSLIPAPVRDQQLKHQATWKMGGQSAPWLLLGMLVVFLLGCAGVLPYTGRLKVRPPPPRKAPPPSGTFDLRNYAIVAGVEPPRRHALVRTFFALLWPVVFFFAAAVVMLSLSGVSSVENEVVRKQLQDQAAQAAAPWVVLGSLVVFVLGCVGVLPWTGAYKRKRPAAPEGPPAPPAGDGSSSFFTANRT
jgi:hypothetical protein